MLEAELLLKVPKDWMSEITDRFGVRVKVLDRKPYGKQGVHDLVELVVKDQDLEEVRSHVRWNPFVAKASFYTTEEGKALGAVSTAEDGHPEEVWRAAPRWRSRSATLTGQESVADLVADHPELRLLHLSYGICSCCAGDSTLPMSADVRGIRWETMLDDIRRELG